MASPREFTVIIPAYNEEAVIARCLLTLLKDMPPDNLMEVIVAANGCRDMTVEVARTAAPHVRIVDLPNGSKTSAINSANAIASHFPRIYLDADVECSYATAIALVEALEDPGAMTAAPAIDMDLDRSDWLVKVYYRVWSKRPYATSGNGGAGCYALSRAGFETIGSFPDIVADDIWIHTRFPKSQKRYVPNDRNGNAVCTMVHPPRNALEQIRVEARRQAGNAEVLCLHPSPYPAQSGGRGGVGALLRDGINPLDIAIFFGMKLAARLVARWNGWRGCTSWSRDLSSRQV